MWPLAILTGDHSLTRVFYKKMYDHFARLKGSGHNNKVTILAR